MDKGYYRKRCRVRAIGLEIVAIHNKNGQGLLHKKYDFLENAIKSQSTIKMDKGYYINKFCLLK